MPLNWPMSSLEIYNAVSCFPAVVPAFKNSVALSDHSHYRPIYVLPHFVKLIKTLFWIIQALHLTGSFKQKKYDIRFSSSTADLLILPGGGLKKYVMLKDKYNRPRALSLDTSKSFCRVWLGDFLDKLKRIWYFRPIIFDLIFLIKLRIDICLERPLI